MDIVSVARSTAHELRLALLPVRRCAVAAASKRGCHAQVELAESFRDWLPGLCSRLLPERRLAVARVGEVAL
eukprot:4986501-Prymnesium_polylepis.1